jgi:hypothetical protein
MSTPVVYSFLGDALGIKWPGVLSALLRFCGLSFCPMTFGVVVDRDIRIPTSVVRVVNNAVFR